MSVLEIKHLYSGYNDKVVIRDINFNINSGEILGIVGESGSGKTTLLKSIIRNPDHNISIRQGEVLFKGLPLHGISQREMSEIKGSEIGYIFQNPALSFNPIRKLKKQFKDFYDSKAKDMDKNSYLDKVKSLMQRFELKEPERILNSYPWELSGGMLQRVSLVMATVLKPDLLLADEPTSALDVVSQKSVLKEFKDLANEGNSIILVTHNMGVVEEVCDKMLVLFRGNLVEAGLTKAVLEHPIHPYTRALINTVPCICGKLPCEMEQSQFDYSDAKAFCSCEEHYVSEVIV